VRARAERWRPWRAYAVIALWTEPRPAPPRAPVRARRPTTSNRKVPA
jgi:AraC family transcriptional regulator of adaptative response / DNA-3-methyladenine glycosylase II